MLVPADQIAFVEKAITEGTNGRAKMKKEKDLYYSVIDGEVKVFTELIKYASMQPENLHGA